MAHVRMPQGSNVSKPTEREIVQPSRRAGDVPTRPRPARRGTEPPAAVAAPAAPSAQPPRAVYSVQHTGMSLRELYSLEQMRPIAQQLAPGLTQCLRQHSDDALAATLRVTQGFNLFVSIGDDGHVQRVAVSAPFSQSAEFVRCSQRLVNRLTFGPTRSGSAGTFNLAYAVRRSE
jgi:hypothetical protein